MSPPCPKPFTPIHLSVFSITSISTPALRLQRFAAVVMRIREPKTTALIFASGKMVVTGAKSEDDSRLASRKYARIIQKLGFEAKFAEFKIQNIVGSCDVHFPIRLEGLAFSHGAFSSYEPEVSDHRPISTSRFPHSASDSASNSFSPLLTVNRNLTYFTLPPPLPRIIACADSLLSYSPA